MLTSPLREDQVEVFNEMLYNVQPTVYFRLFITMAINRATCKAIHDAHMSRFRNTHGLHWRHQHSYNSLEHQPKGADLSLNCWYYI